ncbi:EpsG family protein [Leptothrix ochracea]|uniref:EpsG family protein n=1 Tax=Leptothrix ochracea TaxID=735331 RepID=UPI0034E1E709
MFTNELIVVAILWGVGSLVVPRLDRFFALTFTVIASVLCGLRGGGLDYDGYVSMIDASRAVDGLDVAVVLAVAKDPGFYLVNVLSEFIGQDYWIVFVLMALLGFVPKFMMADFVGAYRTLFLVFYFFLMAPGLEFAAIRFSVAIAFVGLFCISGYVKKWIYAFSSFMFHISMIVLVVAFFGRIRGFIFRNAFFVGFGSFLFIYIVLGDISSYFEDRSGSLGAGNIGSIIFPVFNFFWVVVFANSKRITAFMARDVCFRSVASLYVYFSLLSMAFSLSFIAASFRFLEGGLFFGLYAFFVYGVNRRFDVVVLSCLLSIIFQLIGFNIVRGTWEALWVI